ncbi:hypothetical protein [Deinococcus sp. Leaf326]|uniref:hypothetical protein n=1 Tax=Deinococcus sp. Leaf326 TaxID=1736338 RepID=UPI0006FBDDE0|nr:hypothetical protein [Deinococcus sp. Leaf326]KQR37786.1 hypothetical protein ASF71_14995 [Deinococcus sp. Leaf326]
MTGLLRPRHDAWVEMHSGTAFDLLAPTVDMVRLGDVAHHLAGINRFTGRFDYTVAQHSILVVELLRAKGVTDPLVLLQGLVHDSPEAYTGDLSKPLKRLCTGFQEVEERVWRVCSRYFKVPELLHQVVKDADWLACRLEAHWYGQQVPVHGWAGGDPQSSVSAEVLGHLRATGDRQTWTRRWLTALAFLQSAAAQRTPVKAVKYA